ncbi:MAG: hypothetical protein ABH869_00360 [Candidatus Omnitrophota bacterium]
MRKRLIYFWVIAFLCAWFFQGQAFCECTQEINEDVSVAAYGTVVGVSMDSITITGLNETGDMNEVTYYFGPDTEMDNVNSADEIQIDDDVDIQYVEKNGDKVVTYIYVYASRDETV